jgi:NAD(P)-dependent dehydrogenase (short-subunit alcohol dehydrogenase family)
VEVADKVAIVTGGGGGIGAALGERLVAAGARVLLADLDADAAQAAAERAAARLPAEDRPGAAIGVGADVTEPDAIAGTIERAESDLGPVQLFFANAGILGAPGLGDEDAWDTTFEVNVRAHVRAANAIVPRWVERGTGGYFVSTASAAGLLTQIGGAAYAVTKHAAVGFAEWLAVTYGDQGIGVSCLCPMGVRTAMLEHGAGSHLGSAARAVTSAGDVIDAAKVADDVLAAVGEERFLILPHPQVLDMYRQKGSDYDRWLRGMRRYQARLQQDEN